MPRFVIEPGQTLPRRILVYGVTGSGKTTMASRLSEGTGIPWHSVDDLTWERNWTQAPVEIQKERIGLICSQDAWILDTAYGQWLEIPLARAELIVALDYPRWLSLSRLIRRTLARMIDGRAVCNGNRESLRNMLSRDSIIAWHFRSFARKKSRIRAFESSDRGPAVLRFAGPGAAARWLSSLAPEVGC